MADFSALSAAYERGRIAWALPRALLVALAALPAVFAGASSTRALLLALVLGAVALFAGWRSRAGAAGAAAGAAIAAVPLLMGPVMQGACCAGGVCFSWCAVACASCSLVVGACAGFAFSRVRSFRADFFGAAVVCAAAGALLCPVTGVGSVLGAVVGAVVGFSPVVAFRKALA